MTFLFKPYDLALHQFDCTIDGSSGEIDIEQDGGYYGDRVNLYLHPDELELLAREGRKHEAAYALDMYMHYGCDLDWGE